MGYVVVDGIRFRLHTDTKLVVAQRGQAIRTTN
jgi:hypothetical protein